MGREVGRLHSTFKLGHEVVVGMLHYNVKLGWESQWVGYNLGYTTASSCVAVIVTGYFQLQGRPGSNYNEHITML